MSFRLILKTVEMQPGSSQDVQIVMDKVPAGLAGFDITISVSDPEIAEITAVSFPSWGPTTNELFSSFKFSLDKNG